MFELGILLVIQTNICCVQSNSEHFQMVIIEIHSGVTMIYAARVTGAFTDMHF